MNEQDLEQAQEIYRKRKFVRSSLDSVLAAETLGLKDARLNLSFLKTNERFPSQFAQAVLDAASAREIYAPSQENSSKTGCATSTHPCAPSDANHRRQLRHSPSLPTLNEPFDARETKNKTASH
jgi:hypothetical protein